MGKKKKKQEQINVPDFLGRGMTYVYLVLMMGLFPIYYPGHLIGIHSVKTTFFMIVAAIYLCLIAVPLLAKGAAYVKEHHKIGFSAADAFLAVFTAAVLLSTVFALDKTAAIYGNSRMKTGMIVLLLCIASYYAVKSYARYDKALVWINLLASGFIYLSGILITCKTDPLNMQKNIIEAQKGIFVSPLGNINYNVAYISLILPAAMAMFLLCKETLMKRVLAVYLYIGFVDIICLRAESAVAMLAFAFVLLLYFALENGEWLKRYLMVVQLFLGADLTVYALKNLLGDHMYEFDGLNAVMLRTEIVIAGAVLIAVLWFVQRKWKAAEEKSLLRLQKIYGIALIALFAAGVLAVLGCNLFFKEAAAGTIFDSLVLKDTTGNFRGYVWSRTAELFRKLPVVNQLFGCGLGCFYDFLYPTYGADMLERFNSVFYDPHNDFFQVLVTNGIVGVIGFFGGIFATIAAAAKKRKNRKLQMAVLMSLACFLVQGLVNSYTIFAIPLVFIMLALAYASPAEEQI